MTLEQAIEMFKSEYSKDISALSDLTPNFAWWFASGPYRGEQDVERRFHVGIEQIEKFFEFHEQQVIWIAPDGTPGIELRFDIDLDGVPVLGFIDAIVTGPDGKPKVRDYKTGATPGDDFQMGVYAVAVAETYGIEAPTSGDYYMAGKKGKPGKPTHPYDLSEWTRERVTEEFHKLEEDIQKGDFAPNPSPDGCRFCSVNLSCEYSMA